MARRKWRNCRCNRGDRGAVIDFRHVIGHLLRKPGAFAGYRWREELFPAPVYRAAYDHLTRISTEADRRYLEILKVAADEGQTVGGKRAGASAGSAASGDLGRGGAGHARHLAGSPTAVAGAAALGGVPEGLRCAAGWPWRKTNTEEPSETQGGGGMSAPTDPTVMLLRSFCLATMAGQYEEVMQRAEKEGWSHRQVLRHLCESEAVERGQKRTARLLAESGLPETKTLSTLDEALLPRQGAAATARADRRRLCGPRGQRAGLRAAGTRQDAFPRGAGPGADPAAFQAGAVSSDFQTGGAVAGGQAGPAAWRRNSKSSTATMC